MHICERIKKLVESSKAEIESIREILGKIEKSKDKKELERVQSELEERLLNSTCRSQIQEVDRLKMNFKQELERFMSVRDIVFNKHGYVSFLSSDNFKDKNLDLSGCEQLEEVDFRWSNIRNPKLPKSVEKIDFEGCKILNEDLDLSGCEKLEEVYLQESGGKNIYLNEQQFTAYEKDKLKILKGPDTKILLKK